MAPIDRREQERARRRQAILAAARAVFAQGGFHRATVEAIAQRAEVGKGTVYLYFENKEAILAELVLQALAELTARLQAASDRCSVLHPDQKLRAMAEAYLIFAQNAPDYFRLLNAFDRGAFQEGISAGRRGQILAESERALGLVVQAVSDGMALGLFAPGDPRQAAGVLWAALNGALALTAHPLRREMMQTDVSRLYYAALEVCLRGLSGGPDTSPRPA
ncbi:MAG: TetR/AcrR family transcriptional regulator [Anaerolineae bacterium]